MNNPNQTFPECLIVENHYPLSPESGVTAESDGDNDDSINPEDLALIFSI